jgi:hypothetical protein
MDIYLIGIAVLGGLGILIAWRRRQRRLTLTEHSVRCPAYDCQASLIVRTDPIASPSSRHRDVTACSLQPATPFVPPTRTAYFSDMPPTPYPYEVDRTPYHSDEVRCSKGCLAVLNAGASGDRAEPIRCTSGMSDALELARQTQSPSIMRVMWEHST